MDKTTQPRELVCYGPKPPAATLGPLDTAVLSSLRDLRGCFKRHGLHARYVFQSIGRRLPPLTPPYRYTVTIQAVCGSLRRLERVGLSQRTTTGAWRAATR